MNLYEFIILMASMEAPQDHIEHAGKAAARAIERRAIKYDQNAVEWLDAVNFEKAPGGPIQWVAYAYQMMRMPEKHITQGLPYGEERWKAIVKLESYTEAKIVQQELWLIRLQDEKQSCAKSCGPSDYREGGKCDQKGCYKRDEEPEQLVPEKIQVESSQ